jgi:hypothetical protein
MPSASHSQPRPAALDELLQAHGVAEGVAGLQRSISMSGEVMARTL